MGEPALAVRSTIEPEPLSDLHEMLAHIGREHHAARLNRIANHPSVYPFIKGWKTGAIDLAAAVVDPRNILLTGRYGAVLFHQRQPGLYEGHSMALPEGRGRWMLGFAEAAIHWMFSRSDAMELITRCPQGNAPALALTKRIGGKEWFTNPAGWIMDRDPIPAAIYRRNMQDWLDTGPGLVERGQWFRRRLKEEFARHNQTMPDWYFDDAYDRQIGGAVEMLLGGQAVKGQVFFNRFACMAGAQEIALVSVDPITINTGYALVIFRDADFYIATFL